jgi:hypothetical protein
LLVNETSVHDWIHEPNERSRSGKQVSVIEPMPRCDSPRGALALPAATGTTASRPTPAVARPATDGSSPPSHSLDTESAMLVPLARSRIGVFPGDPHKGDARRGDFTPLRARPRCGVPSSQPVRGRSKEPAPGNRDTSSGSKSRYARSDASREFTIGETIDIFAVSAACRFITKCIS